MKIISCNRKKSVYIITKPLQYINATNIPDELEKDCFLVDLFYNTENFYLNVKKHSVHWKNIKVFKSRYNALLKIIRHRKSYDKLYIDSDFGILITVLFLILGKIRIYTYEEGFGSYRFIRNNLSIVDKIKSTIYSFLGCENWIGGNVFTTGSYLYYPEAFKKLIGNKKEIHFFKKKFISHLSGLKEINHYYDSVNFERFRNQNVIVYLSTWEINPNVNKILKNYMDYIKVLKPHPHIKEQVDFQNLYDVKISNSLPAEYFLTQLYNVCKNLVIIHENSSALVYLAPFNIKEINISESYLKLDYTNILDTIKHDKTWNQIH
jgi:hypothetical protein